jgi:hypothetical protein
LMPLPAGKPRRRIIRATTRLRRSHAVEWDRIGIAETIATELLDLPQPDDLVPLGRAQQEFAIVVGETVTGITTGHCRLVIASEQ